MQRNRFDMGIKCIDSSLALEEKGVTTKAATQIIREALGCDIIYKFSMHEFDDLILNILASCGNY